MFVSGLKIARLGAAVQQQSVRNSSMATKPRNYVSTTEKCIHGICIAVGIMATPTYIACNFKNYTGRTDY